MNDDQATAQQLSTSDPDFYNLSLLSVTVLEPHSGLVAAAPLPPSLSLFYCVLRNFVILTTLNALVFLLHHCDCSLWLFTVLVGQEDDIVYGSVSSTGGLSAAH